MKRRILKICLYMILPLAAAALAAVAAIWLWSWRIPLDPATLPGTMTLSPERAAAPGRAVTAEVRLKLPVRFNIAGLAVEPGTASVVSGEAVYSSRWHWTHRTWRIAVTLRGLRTGEVPPGKVTATLRQSGGGGDAEKLVFEIPGFAVGESDTTEQTLHTADPEPIPGPGSRLRRLWLLVIPVALLAWLLLRRRGKTERELPPWERAHAELAVLETEARGGKVVPERGIGKLTDIVRSYLEERFSLPLSARTTPEFLSGLDADGSPLENTDRAFLRGFMNEADLVKFARADASCDALVSAIGKAETLVENTTPHDKPDDKGAAR